MLKEMFEFLILSVKIRIIGTKGARLTKTNPELAYRYWDEKDLEGMISRWHGYFVKFGVKEEDLKDVLGFSDVVTEVMNTYRFE